MDLQTIVRETKQLSDNVLVAKLTNGFDVAYEKQLEKELQVYEDEDSNIREKREVGKRTTVKYSLLPIQRRGILSGHNSEEINTNKPRIFSPQAHSSIDAYISERTSDIEDFREISKQLFEEFTVSLGIKEFKYRDWKEYGRVSLTVLGWPVFLSWYLISGHKHDASGDGGLAILASPLLLPLLAKEFFAPNEFLRKASRSKTTEGVLYVENRGDDPAVVFHHDDNPKRFTQLEIIFPNGITLTDHGLFTYPNQEYVLGKYHEAKFFFHPEGDLSQRVYDLNEREQKVGNRRAEFYHQLREADHDGFLKSVGFLS